MTKLIDALLVRTHFGKIINVKFDKKVIVSSKRQQALSVVGQFHSGKQDLAEKHDFYLAEGYGK